MKLDGYKLILCGRKDAGIRNRAQHYTADIWHMIWRFPADLLMWWTSSDFLPIEFEISIFPPSIFYTSNLQESSMGSKSGRSTFLPSHTDMTSLSLAHARFHHMIQNVCKRACGRKICTKSLCALFVAGHTVHCSVLQFIAIFIKWSTWQFFRPACLRSNLINYFLRRSCVPILRIFFLIASQYQWKTPKWDVLSSHLHLFGLLLLRPTFQFL